MEIDFGVIELLMKKARDERLRKEQEAREKEILVRTQTAEWARQEAEYHVPLIKKLIYETAAAERNVCSYTFHISPKTRMTYHDWQAEALVCRITAAAMFDNSDLSVRFGHDYVTISWRPLPTDQSE